VTARWSAAAVPPSAEALAHSGLPRPLADLLALRGIHSPAEAERFLDPRLERLTAARALPGLPEAAARLAAAVRGGERTTIVGDYDADGVSASALLGAVVRGAGGEVEIVLPRRDGDGYGLQAAHSRRAAAAGSTLLIAVDSGTNALEAWDEALALGLDLVVVDHHLADPGDRDARVLVVNPRVAPGEPDQRELTAAGLALHLAARLLPELGREVPWDALLRVACLGTIADVAPLIGDNRVIAALGLRALGQIRSPGLRALLGVASVRAPVRAGDVAFRIAPRLNAAGRLASADEALELLLTRDVGRARELAALLERRNAERQRIELQLLEEARRQVVGGPLPGLVALWSERWHRGVVGIAAARLARELHRPTLLLAVDGETATGSGRSVAGLSLHELLAPFAGRLLRFGGHAQAVGLTVARAGLEELRTAWEAAAAPWLETLAVRVLRYDLALPAAAVDDRLAAQLDRLEPFGAGNHEPVFRFGPVRLAGAPRAFGRGHLGFELDRGRAASPLPVVAWRGAGREPPAGGDLELLAAVERDPYRGLRLRLIDLRAWRGGCND
jgi:single-stranded-DNA-specific exonuclease